MQKTSEISKITQKISENTYISPLTAAATAAAAASDAVLLVSSVANDSLHFWLSAIFSENPRVFLSISLICL